MLHRFATVDLSRCRRALARGWVRAAVVLIAAFAAIAPATAGEGRGGRMARPPMLRAGPFAPRMMRQERAGPPVRQMREQPVPQAVPIERPIEPVPQGRPGRLTPDERRALRQQINDAGRDIYRVPRR